MNGKTSKDQDIKSCKTLELQGLACSKWPALAVASLILGEGGTYMAGDTADLQL